MRVRFLLPVLVFLLVPFSSGRAGQLRVAIDIGHSPGAPGTLSATNRPEYDFNRRMALLLVRELGKNPRLRTVTINPGGRDISLETRVELINAEKPDLLISVHHNSVRERYLTTCSVRGGTARVCNLFRGYSVYISEKNLRARAGRNFALVLCERFLHAGLLPTNSPFEPGEGREPLDIAKGLYRYDNLVVLRKSRCPAVLLECGIIRNRGEELRLRNPAYRLRMARAVKSAVESFAEFVSK